MVMFKKKCPFCFQEVQEYWDDGKYIIECQECSKKGIIVKVISNSQEEAVSLWNTRVFDNHLLNNPTYVLNEISIFNDLIKKCNNKSIIMQKQEVDSVLNNFVFSFNRSEYGYLILPNASYIKCDESHVEELLKLLGIETNREIPELDESIYMKLGIIRVCNHNNCLMVVLPFKITKKQVDCIFNLISTTNIGKINSYCVYEDREKDYTITTFNDLSEMMLYLDKVI